MSSARSPSLSLPSDRRTHAALLQRNELVKFLRTILYLCRDSYPSNLSQKNCAYFLRTTPGTIPAPSTSEDADKIMVKYLDYGLLNGHTLYLLANILNKVRVSSRED